MKTMRYFLILGVALLLAGCATTFRPWNLSEVKEGMDREQVVQILGEPDYVFTKDGAEHMRYSYQEDFSPSSTSSADLVYDSSMDYQMQAVRVERSMQVLEYDVLIVDGKVLNYKDVTN